MTEWSTLKSIWFIMESIDTKKIWPSKYTCNVSSNVSVVTFTLEILVAKKSALNTTPTITPMARLCVINTIITVRIITKASVFGAFLTYLKECQSTVPIDTMTIIPAKIGIGICTTKSPNTIIINMSTTPAVNVDNRLVAPDFTLMTDCPIIAQPPIPPKNPVMIFAIPCPRDSLFLLL